MEEGLTAEVVHFPETSNRRHRQLATRSASQAAQDTAQQRRHAQQHCSTSSNVIASLAHMTVAQQHGSLSNRAVLAPLALGLSAFSLLGRSLLAATLRMFCPCAWPVLHALSLACLLPARQRHWVPRPLLVLGRPFVTPLLVCSIASPIVKRLFPDAWRTGRMWRQFVPVYVWYLWTRRQCSNSSGRSPEDKARRWQHRHEWGGRKVYAMVLDLSGYYVKSAQIMATKGDFMPEQWTRRLVKLFDSMPPRPWREVKQSLQHQVRLSPLGEQKAAMGKKLLLGGAFEIVQEESLASASIAQVHCARLAANVASQLAWQYGPAVVVKVQHRHMESLMHSDLRNIGRLARVMRSVLPFDVMPMVEEIRDAVPKEFDFLREARLMQAIRRRLLACGWQGVAIPQPLLALSTPRLLVMQHMPGVPFTQLLPQAAKDAAVHARLARAVNGLLEVYGRMILGDGLFHADPHPGNLLLQDDDTLVLLDFGQCKALAAPRQLAFARMILALDGGTPEQIAVAMAHLGLDFTANAGGPASPLQVTKMAYIMFDTRYLPEACISPLSENAVIKSIPLTAFPSDLYMVLRAMMLLRGLCFGLGLDIQSAALWRKYAEAVLKDPELSLRAEENRWLDLGEGAPHNGMAAQ